MSKAITIFKDEYRKPSFGSSRVRKNTIRIKINIISKMITPKEYFFMTKFSFFCSLLVSLLILSSRIFFSVSFCNIHQWERNWKWMRKEEKDKKICRWHVFLHSNSAESLTIIMPFLSSYETQKRKKCCNSFNRKNCLTHHFYQQKNIIKFGFKINNKFSIFN